MWENRVMHILLELHMWENRYRQFKDQSWNCTCGKRGSNQKLELHMWENVSPVILYCRNHETSWNNNILFSVSLSVSFCVFPCSKGHFIRAYLDTIWMTLRYHFVCKWKRIRVMKDNLIARLVIICTFGGTIWLNFAKSYVFEEEQVIKVNCI